MAGAGPSLHFEKLDRIPDYVTFVVNSSVIKLKQADYFVSDDQGITDWDYFYKTLPHFKGISMLYEDKLRDHVDKLPPDRVCLFQHKLWFDMRTRTKNPDGLIMTSDPELPIIGARTSAGSAVHIAHLMGCSPIVLLGTDCCYVQEKNYFWQFPGEAKPHRLKGFNCPVRRIFHRGKLMDDHNKEFIDYWAALRKENPWCNIINASTQGLLDSFPKMTLSEVFSKYGHLKKNA